MRFVLVSLLLPGNAAAHAFRERYDLPLPLHYWLAAAGLTVALSFVVFALALQPGRNYTSIFVGRIHPFIIGALRAVSLCVLVVLIGAGFLGTQDPVRNLVPAFVWIAWWIGFTYLCAVFGDLWSLISPWKLFDAKGMYRLPGAVGAWPAVALLLVFAWMELIWHDNAVPANLAWLMLGYSLLTWAGMFAFGTGAWLRSGEVFSVYFAFIARLAPLEWRALRELYLRPLGAGLLEQQPLSPSQAFFVIAMLAIVAFDGLRETPLWGLDETAGLLGLPLIFAAVLWAVCAGMGNAPAGELLRLFVPTLLPIALAYHIAHYLTYLLIAGQVMIPLASDPLGRGWDLFGSARYQIAPGVVGARFAWYTSVIVIVAGHVLAMYAAHRVALARFADRPGARRSQYPFAALMVCYTMLSLWILAQPVVVK